MVDPDDDAPEEELADRGSRIFRRDVMKSAMLGAGTMGLPHAGALQTDASFVDILSADPSNYPEVLLNVAVDTEAGRNGELTAEDFSITEAGVEKAIENFSYTSTSADIAFVFDDTGSMNDQITAMKAKVTQLTDDIEAAGIDARYSLISFKDSVETDLRFTEDAAALKSVVDQLEAAGGDDSPEVNFDALNQALSLDFRTEAQKVLIGITDAPSHYDGDGSEFAEVSIDEIATRIRESGVAYIAVSPGFTDEDSSTRVLAERVDGLWIDINEGNFDQILERIQRLVATAYVLEYITDTPLGESRDIGVEVSDPVEGAGSDESTVDVPPTVGGGDVLANIRSQKLSVADEITRLATSIDERSRVDPTLNSLQQRVSNGSLDEGTARQAIERMIYAENLTEVALAGLGPGVATSPPSSSGVTAPEFRAGVPSERPGALEEFDIAGDFVESMFFIGVGISLIALSVAALPGVAAGAAAGGAGYVGLRAIDKYVGTADDLASIFPGVAAEFAPLVDDVAREGLSNVISGGIGAPRQLVDFVVDQITRENVTNLLLRFGFEKGGGITAGTGFDAKLQEVDDAFNLEESSLQGNQLDAQSVAEQSLNIEAGDVSVRSKIDTIRSKSVRADSVSQLLDLASGVIGLAGSVGGAAGSGVLATSVAVLGKVGSLVAGTAALTFDTLDAIFNLAFGMDDVLNIHNASIDSIIDPSGGGA